MKSEDLIGLAFFDDHVLNAEKAMVFRVSRPSAGNTLKRLSQLPHGGSNLQQNFGFCHFQRDGFSRTKTCRATF